MQGWCGTCPKPRSCWPTRPPATLGAPFRLLTICHKCDSSCSNAQCHAALGGLRTCALLCMYSFPSGDTAGAVSFATTIALVALLHTTISISPTRRERLCSCSNMCDVWHVCLACADFHHSRRSLSLCSPLCGLLCLLLSIRPHVCAAPVACTQSAKMCVSLLAHLTMHVPARVQVFPCAPFFGRVRWWRSWRPAHCWVVVVDWRVYGLGCCFRGAACLCPDDEVQGQVHPSLRSGPLCRIEPCKSPLLLGS